MTSTLDYGLTKDGFNVKNKSVITTEIQNDLTSKFGKPLNFTAPSVFSQLIEPFSTQLAELWEAAGSVYASQFPATGEGDALDGSCSYVNITRLQATSSKVQALVTADNFTEIPANSKALLQDTSYTFSTLEDIEINNNKCYKIEIKITTAAEYTYIVTINNQNYVYEAQPLDSQEEIAAMLQASINSGIIATAIVTDNILIITSISFENDLTVKINDNMNFEQVICIAEFISDTNGSISVPINALNEIYTPVLGWNSITNTIIGQNGRDLESDIELRARREISQQIGGSGTVEAIRSRLLAVTGVSSVSVLENRTDITDANNLPPHSLSAIVLGGVDEDVALTIWKAKPAGIQLFGNTSVVILDSDGLEQLINFSRAINFYIFVNVALTTNDDFIEDSVANIKLQIAKHLNKHNVGETVIYQSLYQYIYAERGITSAIITVGGTLDPLTVPVLSSNNISIDADKISVSDVSYISIS